MIDKRRIISRLSSLHSNDIVSLYSLLSKCPYLPDLDRELLVGCTRELKARAINPETVRDKIARVSEVLTSKRDTSDILALVETTFADVTQAPKNVQDYIDTIVKEVLASDSLREVRSQSV